MGGLPAGVAADVWPGTGALPASASEVEVVVLPFLAAGDRLADLRELPRLRLVQLLTAGAEAVLPYVPAGVTVCTARGAHTASTAEWVVAVILAQLRELPRFVLAQHAGRWERRGTPTLAGSTVLIVGYGSIGAGVEARLGGFEVTIDRIARHSRPGVGGLDELADRLPGADVVVLLVPLTAQTRGLVDASFLRRMRDGALLVNAARGPVVDTDALLAELRAGRLRAAIDVTDPEPLPAGHPLWTAPGLLLTPHVAGSTPLARPRAYALARRQLDRYLSGQPLENVVHAGGY
ncbi:MAG TPA: 2-hydroxyacid dehydrogenase [Mycobacteriales bacterium]|nr:2-hydroxyacid dehydrogenase [Mycobacteriales bacterium]